MAMPIDFLISMAVVFFAFSVLVSGLLELWNASAAKRGRFLWLGIRRLVGDTAEGEEILAGLRRHHAIAALSEADGDGRLASYLPSAVFAAALVDILLSRGAHAPLEQFGMGEAIFQLPDDLPLKQVLSMLWRREQGDAARVEAALAQYFDQSMDRVSGWYKRDAQRCGMVLGLLLALALNVDAVHIGAALWQERPLARQMAERGAALAARGAIGAATAGESRVLPAQMPIGWPARWFTEMPAQFGAGQLAWHCLATLLGYVLMALSCLVGAPIWYQMLTSLLPLRAAGGVPARMADAPAVAPAPVPAPAVAPAVPAGGRLNPLEQDISARGEVTLLQAALGVAGSGSFDEATRDAIRRRQHEHGYAATGQLTQLLLERLQD